MSFRNPLVAPVTIAGPVTVETAGTPGSVTQTGAATTLAPPAGTPTAAARSVSASAQAAGSVTGPAVASSTLIAAPGVASRLELHALNVNLTQTTVTGGRVQLQRLDTGAVLWDSGALNQGPGAVATQSYPFDFQGATLPLNVGVKLVLVSGDANTLAAATLVYNVLA